MVRIAIPSDTDRGLEAKVYEHFGRAPYYTLVDVEGGSIVNVEPMVNPAIQHTPGVLPSYLRDRGVKVVIAMGIGPRAVSMFESYGIKVVTGASGRIREVVDAYVKGRLRSRPYTPKHRFRFHQA